MHAAQFKTFEHQSASAHGVNGLHATLLQHATVTGCRNKPLINRPHQTKLSNLQWHCVPCRAQLFGMTAER